MKIDILYPLCFSLYFIKLINKSFDWINSGYWISIKWLLSSLGCLSNDYPNYVMENSKALDSNYYW